MTETDLFHIIFGGVLGAFITVCALIFTPRRRKCGLSQSWQGPRKEPEAQWGNWTSEIGQLLGRK